MERTQRWKATLLAGFALLTFAAYGCNSQGNEADDGRESSQNPEELSSETEDAMSMKIPVEDQAQVAADEQLATVALSNYLGYKYGYQEGDYIVLSDNPELSYAFYIGGELKTYGSARYSGYRIAQIEKDDTSYDVRYSPTGDTGQYVYGGLDNIESAALESDVLSAALDILPEAPVSSRTAIGRLATDGSRTFMLLEGRYDGSDWYGPVPQPEGTFAIVLNYDAEPPSLDTMDAAMAQLFSGAKERGVVVVVQYCYPSGSADDPNSDQTLPRHYWANSE